MLDGVSVRAVGRGVVAPARLSARISLGSGVGRERAGRGLCAARSGSGKSTAVLVALGLLATGRRTVGLLPRDARPDDASTAAAFRDLAELSGTGLEAWWAGLTWVPQRPSLPPGGCARSCWTASPT